MNILPKKSWHVRNKDNVERVRRDEENARKEEKEKERRAALAEQEARTALLRDRATKKLVKGGKSHDPTMVLADSKPKHLNFFADIEEGLRSGSNSEYEAEKKAEQEKREKAIGVLTYLGQSLKDTESEKPWYVKSHKHRMVDPVAGRESAKEKDRKESLDPLNEMKKYLEIKKSHKEDKGKKHKIAGKDSSRQKQSIKEMRRERLRREQEEREKERRLLANIGKEKHSAAIRGPNYDAPQRYNSQYNPEFARRPRDDSRYRPF